MVETDFAYAIENCQVFRSLSRNDVERVIKLAIRRELKKGEYLVNQGDSWPYLFLVTRGQLVAEKDSDDGRTFVVATIKKGEVFWGITFFIEEALMPASMRAHEDTVLYSWSQHALQPFIKANGSFSWEISRLVVSRIQHVSEILESMTFRPIAVRLARLLVSIADGGEKTSIERNLTLDEMAARVGSTREMVCRLLYKFSDEGMIRITRTDFSILDADELIKRAQK